VAIGLYLYKGRLKTKMNELRWYIKCYSKK
jgi:hypothetical protein